jgi:hypothetical protein
MLRDTIDSFLCNLVSTVKNTLKNGNMSTWGRIKTEAHELTCPSIAAVVNMQNRCDEPIRAAQHSGQCNEAKPLGNRLSTLSRL